MPMKLSIIIPAYNEEKRIEKTIHVYCNFFFKKKQEINLDFELVIVLNGCKDDTFNVVENIRKELNSHIIIIDLLAAGKGLAIKTGFADALTRNNNIIGFVDADMATSPEAFFALVFSLLQSSISLPKIPYAKHNEAQGDIDGAIASRYMLGSKITPARPAYKRWGSKFIYEPYVWLLFGLSYSDYQCGAKVFKRVVIEKIISQLTVTQWAFDVELLYLCKKHGFIIKEIPTVWNDQEDSKLTLRGGLRMFKALFNVWKQHYF